MEKTTSASTLQKVWKCKATDSGVWTGEMPTLRIAIETPQHLAYEKNSANVGRAGVYWWKKQIFLKIWVQEIYFAIGYNTQ